MPRANPVFITAKATSNKSADAEVPILKVESVLNRIERAGKRYYLVKWVVSQENEWEPVENLQPLVVAEFEAKIEAGIQKLEDVADSDLPEHLRESRRPARRSAAQAKAATAAMSMNENDEPGSEEEPTDEDEEFTQIKPKKGSKGSVGARKNGGRKESSEEEEDDSDDDEAESPAKKKSKTSSTMNGSVSGNSQSQTSKNGSQASAGRRGADAPMALPIDTYLIRDADFNFKKDERPYLKNGIPIWRIDNKHLIQLFQRFKPDDYTNYVRTDMYDAWNYQDATGLHKLEVKSCQRSHGRDSEVIVELADVWVSKIRTYEAEQGIVVVGGPPIPPTPANNVAKPVAASGASTSSNNEGGSTGAAEVGPSCSQNQQQASGSKKKDSEDEEEESDEEDSHEDETDGDD